MRGLVHGDFALRLRRVVVVGSRKGEDFLVQGAGQGDGVSIAVAELAQCGLVEWVDCCREVAEPVLHPAG